MRSLVSGAMRSSHRTAGSRSRRYSRAVRIGDYIALSATHVVGTPRNSARGHEHRRPAAGPHRDRGTSVYARSCTASAAKRSASSTTPPQGRSP